MNVLLIAPEFGLSAVADEVRAVSLALHPVVLSGTVNRRDVLDALRRHSWDVIWFATHGDSSGIRLSDGPISIADLTAVVRASGAWLVVLNTCSSRLIGLELHYELQVSVITTQAEVDDLTAYQTGALLAQELAKTKDVVRAFEASRPGQGQNYYLFHNAGRDEATEVRTIMMLNEWGSRLASKIDGLARRLDRELEELRKDLENLSRRVQEQRKVPPGRRIAFVAAFWLLFLPVPLFFSPVRELLDIGWKSALVFTALAYAAGAALWGHVWWGGGDG